MKTLKTFLSPKEAAVEIWGEWTYSTKNKIYRWLKNGYFNEIATLHNCPIIKDGNHYHIPNALIKAIRGDQ